MEKRVVEEAKVTEIEECWQKALKGEIQVPVDVTLAVFFGICELAKKGEGKIRILVAGGPSCVGIGGVDYEIIWRRGNRKRKFRATIAFGTTLKDYLRTLPETMFFGDKKERASILKDY